MCFFIVFSVDADQCVEGYNQNMSLLGKFGVDFDPKYRLVDLLSTWQFYATLRRLLNFAL